MSYRAILRASLFSISMAAVAAFPADAQDSGGAWAGKAFTMVIGADAGGGYDMIGRAVAIHMGRHLPGSPRIVPQNMPGAGGVRATNYIANVAERDGTVLGILNRGVIYAGVLQSEGVQFRSEQMNWLGSPSKEISLCAVWHEAPISTIKDALVTEAIIGGTSPNDDTVALTALMNNVLGTKFRIVTGYKSGTEINIAMERGEVHGRCGWSWASIQLQRPDWIKDRKIHLLVSQGFEANPEFPGVPLAIDMATNDDQRRILNFILARQIMGRPFVAPPGVPADRVVALRKAFMATMVDPLFLADMKKQRFDLDPVSGEELQKLVGQVADVPKDLAEKAEQALLVKQDTGKP